MVATLNREEPVYQAARDGELTIDSDGRIWRVAVRRGDRWTGGTRLLACTPRRAEKLSGKYLQVRVVFAGKRFHALAHRVVWLHFNGPIPDGLTVNHKNGDHVDNRPVNLELATHVEQAAHARGVLRRGRLNQFGESNPMAKLTTAQVTEICAARADGTLLRVLAAQYRVSEQAISKIVRGERRSLG